MIVCDLPPLLALFKGMSVCVCVSLSTLALQCGMAMIHFSAVFKDSKAMRVCKLRSRVREKRVHGMCVHTSVCVCVRLCVWACDANNLPPAGFKRRKSSCLNSSCAPF